MFILANPHRTMEKLLKTRYFALAFVMLMAVMTVNADVPPRPANANELVYDYAHVIDSASLAIINDSLKNLYVYNKMQVVILTVESLDGMDKFDYCQEVFEKWGIGDKKLNNGVLILVKPKQEGSKGQVRIHTGYGAEGILPDLLCNKLVEDSMIPAFKEEKYGIAIRRAVDAIVPAMKGEYPQEVADFLQEKKKDSIIAAIVYSIFYILICGLIWYFFFMPTKKDWYSIMASPLIAASISSSSGRRSGGSSWTSSSRSSGSSWSSSSSSSSSWSWGGGSSGGGGAGGSW